LPEGAGKAHQPISNKYFVNVSAIPEQIGPYQVQREIGRGGMGVIHLAHDARLQRDVAIKTVAPELARNTERLARFKREARLIAQLNHPHIAQIYHLLEHEGTTYLVLEYVTGRSLAEMIDLDGALDAETALDLGAQVARAMEAAHARGIVHRDLKPANVRVTEDGTAKILDFGLARGVLAKDGRAADGADIAQQDDPAIRPSTLAGTPGYMAPEQARGEQVDARADIFAFGCLLYECLTGEPPFTGATDEDLIAATLTAEPDWAVLPGSLPEPVLGLIQHCLIKSRDDRLRSIADGRVILDAALGRRVTPSTHRRPVADIPNNLPQPTTSFVGRAGQLQELAGLLSETRLLTLTGAGGCGKTRLALELARKMIDRFPDGVFLAELAPMENPDFIPGAVAAALGVKDQPNRTTVEVLCEHLAGRTFLLVLDNCEHVLDAVSDLSSELLGAARGLRIMATSREVLRVPGEHLWRVPNLTLPQDDDPSVVASSEAVTLFVDRARALKPSFALGAANAATVARICRRLEGIPLAIELAAARMKVLTPQEIDERLDDCFRLLTDDSRAVMEHHRTLRAAVDWSYRMLSGIEKKMLRTLSVFAGGWSLEGAAAVCGPGAEDGSDLDEFGVLDLLTHLVDKSLVIADEIGGESRYRLLETVRQYAAERLEEANEASEARNRHLDFYLALAEKAEPQLTGSGQAAWLERIEAEHENVLTALDRCEVAEEGAAKALRLCGFLMRFWFMHGHLKTGIEACATALARPGAQQRTAARAAALYAAGVMAQSLGEYEKATQLASESLSVQRELGDRQGIANALNSLGNTAYYRGDLAEAKRLHEESLIIKRLLEDKPGIASSLNNLGNVAADRGSLAEAQRMYEEALDLNRETGNRAWQAINLNNLGLVAYHRGDLPVAKRLHEESLAIRRDLGHKHGIAESLGHLGKVARNEGDLLEARRLLEESLTIRRDIEEKLGIADSLDDVAMAAAYLGEHERAARILGTVEHFREQIGAPRPWPDQKELDGCLAGSRESMGHAAFDEAVRTGRALSLDDAVTEALEWLRAERVDTKASTVLVTDPGRSTGG
jgi:non-specific serine/threonine protein kinase